MSWKLIICVVLIMKILSVTSLKCYQCNSKEDPRCLDLAAHPPHNVSHFYKDCEGDFKDKEPFCRKIDFTILDNHMRRIVRTCGYERSRLPCYNADNDHHFETVCQCFTDGCNTSSHLSILDFNFMILIALFNYFLYLMC